MVVVTVTNRVEVEEVPESSPVPPHELTAALPTLKREFEHPIPALPGQPGPTGEIDVTWRPIPSGISVPRGGMGRVRRILSATGVPYRVVDARASGCPMTVRHRYPKGGVPWDHQERMVVAAMARQNCLLRAETGGGKTSAALALACRVGRWMLVIVHTKGLLKQWVERIREECGLREIDIGIVQGPTRRLAPLTVVMQKTLAIRPLVEDQMAMFGTVVFDEVQTAAADTFFAAIDPFPAQYRIGISKDERRRDGREYMIRDLFGDVVAEVPRQEVVQKGIVHDVQVALVPTGYEPPGWYRQAKASGNPFRIRWAHTKLQGELATDPGRITIAADLAAQEARAGHVVALLADRRAACERLAAGLVARGFPPGVMVGGPENEREFDEAVRNAASGKIRTVVGTIKAVGTGIDVPTLDRAVLCSHIGNEQLLGQVRGRFCRTSAGKEGARLYYLWDRAITGLKAVENLARWNDDVVVLDRQVWVPADEYLKREKAYRGGIRRT
jgi:superfamily II DNA or RNA helicase